MRISFDLDDTLICGASVPVEPPLSWWRRWRYPEPLRQGTLMLMKGLIKRGCTLWIYTSSCRSPGYLKAWFASLGIPLEGVVNQARHQHLFGWRGPSKFPPAFGIDLHIDDSLGVAMEGADHRFAVLHIEPEDVAWVEKVLAMVDARLDSSPRPKTATSRQSLLHTLGSLRHRFRRTTVADCPLPYYAIDFVEPDSA